MSPDPSWPGYKPLKRCVENIGSKSYQSATHDFRNAYNHRFSPRIIIGMTRMVTRQVNPQTKTVSYAFGGTPALTLETVVELLAEQCKFGYAGFESFKSLIREQERSISEHQFLYPPK